MSIHKSQKTQLENFLDAYLQDLLAMSDKEVLEGTDLVALKAEGLRMLDSAKAEAGKRRLATAQSRMASAPTAITEQTQDVSASEARTYLKKAANDPRFTLAARELGDMSDADAIWLYQQIRLLEEQSDSGSDGGT